MPLKFITSSLAFLFFSLAVFAQETPKDKALQQFKDEHYHEAVATLTEALQEMPNDAELYYYRGFFNHYIGSDSRLFKGYNTDFTEVILADLDKAIELRADYGDAKYFYGAECATQAFRGMQNRDMQSVKSYLQRANERRAFPKWLKEFGRNMLNSCEPDAILFLAGDADLNVCLYLQVVEEVRTDITVMPIANIDRPWYIQFVKDGMRGVLPKVEISLSDQQIMQIRPFKWKPTPVEISIKESDKVKYKLDSDCKMQWNVEPDLTSERMHSKIGGEEVQKRTYLGPQRANLLQIVEDNMAYRPIFFSNFASPTMYGGLEEYFENYGLVSKLTPINTKDTEFYLNVDAIEHLFVKDNFKDYRTVVSDNIPRIYHMVYVYPYLVEILSEVYKESKETKKMGQLIEFYKENIMIGLNDEAEQSQLKRLQK